LVAERADSGPEKSAVVSHAIKMKSGECTVLLLVLRRAQQG
jgi:hypothetical protein